MLEEIGHLCAKYTYLSPEDITIVASVASRLQLFADLARADLFVTVPTKNTMAALIVAQALPATGVPLHPARLVGQPVLYQNDPVVIQAQNTGASVFRYPRALDGPSISRSIVPIKNTRGWTIGCLVMEKDISDEVSAASQAERLETVTEKLTEAFLEATGHNGVLASVLDEGIVLVDQSGSVTYANRVANRLLEVPGGLLGRPLAQILPEAQLQPADGQQAIVVQELEVNKRVLSVWVLPLSAARETAEALVVLRDLTETRSQERALLRQAVVIREIHHRVKNNLQTIASLLRLQARRSNSPEVRQTYASSVSRIMSMSLVHEILAHRPSGLVSAKEVATRLVQATAQAMASPSLLVQTEVVGEDLALDSDVASTLCLILNELVQNCFKHAFTGMTEGKIAIGFRSKNGRAYVDVWDNGVGMDPGAERQSGGGLGFQLVETLVEQLEGDFVVKSIYGTQVSMSFPMSVRKAETSDETQDASRGGRRRAHNENGHSRNAGGSRL